MRLCLPGWITGFAFLLSGCGPIEIPLGTGGGISLLPPSAFVIRGRMTAPDDPDACPQFEAETGVSYSLSQSPELDNDLFDAVTTPGTVSRIAVQVRDDLDVRCRGGTIVEVQDVLELIPAAES